MSVPRETSRGPNPSSLGHEDTGFQIRDRLIGEGPPSSWVSVSSTVAPTLANRLMRLPQLYSNWLHLQCKGFCR